jgi:hypothetical protein
MNDEILDEINIPLFEWNFNVFWFFDSILSFKINYLVSKRHENRTQY